MRDDGDDDDGDDDRRREEREEREEREGRMAAKEGCNRVCRTCPSRLIGCGICACPSTCAHQSSGCRGRPRA
jgi:hypothetical protein